jgi:activator of HSP90 ATPase
LKSVRVTTIKQTAIIPADPEKVYEAFMNARIHSEFTGSKATCDPTAGGKFTAGDGYISGKNLELEKGKKIVQEWKTTEWPEGYDPSKFKLTLRKVKNGTEIIMVHSNVPDEQAAEFADSWNQFYWTLLKEYFSQNK